MECKNPECDKEHFAEQYTSPVSLLSHTQFEDLRQRFAHIRDNISNYSDPYGAKNKEKCQNHEGCNLDAPQA